MSEKNGTRLAIGIPAGEYLKTDMVFCLINLLGTIGKEITTNVIIQQGIYVHQNRNDIVRGALEVDASHLLFTDGDMVFGTHHVVKLLEADKDIIAAAYNMRKFPLTSTVKLSDGNGHYRKDIKLPNGLFPCAAAGTGFMLIKMKVFKSLKEPWFQTPPTVDGKMLWGEDTFFCREALKAGFEVWAERFDDLKHIGNYYY